MATKARTKMKILERTWTLIVTLATIGYTQQTTTSMKARQLDMVESMAWLIITTATAMVLLV